MKVARLIGLVIISMMSVLISCKKENAKKKYLFRLEFASGDVWEKECYLFEKYKQNKRYKNSRVDEVADLKRSHNLIYTNVLNGETVLYKADSKFLVGSSKVNITVSDFKILNNQSGLMQGLIELEGAYDQNGRKYVVENGTFKFQLLGTFFNVPDSVFTGKWTLKRK